VPLNDGLIKAPLARSSGPRAFPRLSALLAAIGATALLSHAGFAANHREAPITASDRSWMLAQLAHLELLSARTGNAELLLNEALRLFPDYHYALANLAKVHAARASTPKLPSS
jgi:hypothetical protein